MQRWKQPRGWPAHEFISSLADGYNQEVGEGGTLLSVGQKQLISLARACWPIPEIFIMDEATSSVDTLTEALIQRGMEVLMKGRTSVVIAHRLSTIRRADRIIVIEGRQDRRDGHPQRAAAPEATTTTSTPSSSAARPPSSRSPSELAVAA